MWAVDPEPFEIVEHVKGSGSKAPFCYWSRDEEFPWQNYPYRIESEDQRNAEITALNPAQLALAHPLREEESLRNYRRYHIRLGGRALRALWEHRADIPERLWKPSEEVLPYMSTRKEDPKTITTSSFCVDGLRLLNPQGVLCAFYFVRFSGEVRWGITPINYNRGPLFKALVFVV